MQTIKNITIYHKQDGSIYQTTTEDQAQYYDDSTYGWVYGTYSNDTHYVHDGGAVPRVKSFDQLKNEKRAEIANARYWEEVNGITVDGNFVKTDRDSQAQLTYVLSILRGGFIESVPWKNSDGTWQQVTLDDIDPIARAVALHVQSCFAQEKALTDQINTIQEAPELASITWAMENISL